MNVHKTMSKIHRWPPKRLLAVYLALTRAEVYQELLEAWGWTADAYEAWLAETLKGQFLA